jgi:hypothetical protein
MIHFSTVLSNALLATGSLKSLIDGGKIYVYSGPVPTTGDAAVDGSCVLLDTITAAAGAGVTFDGAPANGVLKKTAAETWSGTVATTGVASFYRLCVGSDTGAGAAGAGNYRVQGTIGTDASFDLVFASTSLTATNAQPINTYQLIIAQ